METNNGDTRHRVETEMGNGPIPNVIELIDSVGDENWIKIITSETNGLGSQNIEVEYLMTLP